jgi:effector-binding domain-containing protein
VHLDGPTIVEHPARPYVGVRRDVVIPFGDRIDEAMGTLFSALKIQQIEPVGPVFFKYNIVRMPELQIEFATFVEDAGKAGGELVGGVLPAGRYAEIRYLGHYDRLIEVNAQLIGWVRGRGLEFDVREAEDGDHFAARTETYTNGPDDEPDSSRWETIVSFKLKD